MKKLCLSPLMIMVMTITCLAIYSNTLDCPFVFDDIPKIEENVHIRLIEFNLKSIPKVIQSLSTRPTANFSFILNFLYGGYNVTGYHVVNILIHLTTGILLFLFIKITFSIYIPEKNAFGPSTEELEMIAFFTAFLWLVNPLHTNSVTYIVQRMNSLGALFYLASFICYIKGRKIQISLPLKSNPKKIRGSLPYLCFAGSVIFWLFAVGSKQNTAILPCIIFFYEWLFFQRFHWNIPFNRNLLILFVICSFIIVTFGYLRIAENTGIDPIHEMLILYKCQNFTIIQRIFTEFRVLIFYISLIIFPHPSRLTLDYNYPISSSLVDPLTTIICFTVIILLIGTAILYAKKDRLLSFSIIWFFGNLLIESSFIPLAPIFEHRTYLPSMMVSLLLPLFLFRYIRIKWLNISILVILIIIFGAWTFQRNSVWENDITLWEDCVKKAPNHARSLNNLGRVFLKKNNSVQAVKFLKQAIEISPSYVEAINNLGVAYYNQGQFDKSINLYKQSLDVESENVETLNNMGNALLKLNKPNQAITFYLKAKELDPDFFEPTMNIGNALIQLNRYDEAIALFSQFIEQHPDNFEAHVNLGVALTKKRRFNDALIFFQKALDIKSENAELHNNIGILLIQSGEFDSALKHFKRALEINPNYVNAKNNMNKLKVLLQFSAGDR